MFDRHKLDISKYLVVGPENTNGRPVPFIIQEAVRAGFSCVQIRSKNSSARELIDITKGAAEAIAAEGKTDTVALLVNDRLDVALAAIGAGINVGGVHVGQSDIPVDICRKYLGENAIIGLSAETRNLLEYVKTADTSNIDYFGAGPLYETPSKLDCAADKDGNIILHSVEEFKELAELSHVPITVGGGVKATDVPKLAAAGIGGFFVISAVAGAENPYKAAKELSDLWDKYKK